jgi:hypothetical protein
MPTPHKKWPNELTVVAVFFAVIAIGLVYALFHLTVTSAPGGFQAPPAVKAPTLGEYRSETKSVLAPFLAQAAAIRPEQIGPSATVFKDLVVKTQERLLRVRVPAEAREAHLSFVLLLEQWKRALQGSSADQAVVADMTAKVTSANSWLKTE